VRRDGLTVGEAIFVLVSVTYTALVALLHGGIGFGAARGLQWLWNAAFAGLTGAPRISGWQAAALLFPLILWAALRPGERRRKLRSKGP